MSTEVIVSVGVSAVSCIGALGTLAWSVLRDRHRPSVDRAEVKRFTDEENEHRDIWMRRLDNYLFDDANWHRLMIRLFQQLQDDGMIPANIEIPMPPVVPEPPLRNSP